MTNPNAQSDPVTIETDKRVKQAAQKVLDLAGVENNDGTIQSATVGVEYSVLTVHPDKAIPTISINKPIGEFATAARWSYEVTIGVQDEHASRHALFMKDSSVQPEVRYYNGSADRTLNELEALAIATDLERIAEAQIA